MNTSKLLLSAAAAIGLVCGCTAPATARREPYVKPALIMLTADQAERRGLVVGPASDPSVPLPAAATDANAVLQPAEIKAYTVGRTRDASDPNLLHEEHVVYRREATPRWRLSAPQSAKIMIGPRVTSGDQDLQPLLTKEVAGFIAEQRRARESGDKAIQALFDAVGALSRQQQVLAQRIARDGSEPAEAETGPEFEETEEDAPDSESDSCDR